MKLAEQVLRSHANESNSIPDNYEEAKKQKEQLDNRVATTSEKVRSFDKGANGMTPDSVKNSPDFKEAKKAFDAAFKEQRDFNQHFVKMFKKEIASERKNRFSRLKSEGKLDYEIYHKSYTSAVQAAEDFALKNKYEVDKEKMAQDIGINTRRPKEGETTKFMIDLFKDNKEQRKKLHAQVYCMDSGKFELNMYIS